MCLLCHMLVVHHVTTQFINHLGYNMLNKSSLSVRWQHHLASFVWPTLQNYIYKIYNHMQQRKAANLSHDMTEIVIQPNNHAMKSCHQHSSSSTKQHKLIPWHAMHWAPLPCVFVWNNRGRDDSRSHMWHTKRLQQRLLAQKLCNVKIAGWQSESHFNLPRLLLHHFYLTVYSPVYTPVHVLLA